MAEPTTAKRTDSASDLKAPNFIERAKEKVEAMLHPKNSPDHHKHHKETHGMSEDIDESTPIDEVKAPNLFERAKEEIEALVEAIHPKKEESTSHEASPKKGNGSPLASIGRRFEKICSPRSKDTEKS